MIEMNVRQIDGIPVLELAGEIDGSNAPSVQARLLDLLQPRASVLMDMTRVTYMSSAGLRMLLSAHRSAVAGNARLVLVGLSEDIRDTMEATGFLDFFVIQDTLDSGLAALGS